MLNFLDFGDTKISPGSDSRSSTPDPKTAFKDKKEAIEAFKDLLKEKVDSYVQGIFQLFNYLLF